MADSRTATYLLGTEKVSKLLWRYALPSVIAMIASSLYNIVDSVFIGHGVGPLGLSALAITLPFMNIAAALGAMVGAGASSLLSIKLGQKDRKSAQSILGNVVGLNLVMGVIFGVVCLIFLDPILIAFGASPDTLPYAHDYMKILLLGNVITHMYMGLNNTMRAAGHPVKSMIAMLVAVAGNCILDAVFIFGLDWGIAGAAWATVLAQVIALVIELVHFSSKKHELHFIKGCMKLRKNVIKGIFSIGLAPFMMNLAASLVVILINHALKRNGGDLYIGAYGIINRVALLFFMVIFGLNQGMQPIVGYNYGALKFDRVREAFWKIVAFSTGVVTLGFVVCVFFPHLITWVFTDDPQMQAAAERGFRTIMLAYPLIGFQVVSSSLFQSIGKAGKAMLVSLTRQLLFLVPLLVFLPPIYGADGVWMSFPVADIFSTILSVILIVQQFRQFKRQEISGKLTI